MPAKVALYFILVLLPIFLNAADASKHKGITSKNDLEEPRDRVIRSNGVNLKSNVFKVKSEAEDDDGDEDEDEDAAQGSTAEGSGNDADDDDSDDDDNDKDNSKRVVCKRTCAPPMTFDECANPRCAMKHSIVKDLCYYLCRHQQVRCTNTCESK